MTIYLQIILYHFMYSFQTLQQYTSIFSISAFGAIVINFAAKYAIN